MSTAELVEEQSDHHGSHDHDHDPNLAHHFETMEQQFDAGKLGMWLFLVTEILFFSGLFVAYAVYRALHPEVFVNAHQYLNTTLGAFNTVVLLVSSLTMAWAVRAAQLNQKQLLIRLLAITLACASLFLGVKAVEYSHKWGKGLLWAGAYSAGQDDEATSGNGTDTGDSTSMVETGTKTKTGESKVDGVEAEVAPEGASKSDSHALKEHHSPETTGDGEPHDKADPAHAETSHNEVAHGESGHEGSAHGLTGNEHAESHHAETAHADDESHHHATMALWTLSIPALLGVVICAGGVGFASKRKLPAAKTFWTWLVGVALAFFVGVALGQVVEGFSEHGESAHHVEETKVQTAEEYAEAQRYTGVFFSIYYCMTGVHAIHILAGMGVIAWLLWRAIREDFGSNYFGPVDYVGLYWHLVDLVWIYLFPLLYLIR